MYETASLRCAKLQRATTVLSPCSFNLCSQILTIRPSNACVGRAGNFTGVA
jgi:hypothetical protein